MPENTLRSIQTRRYHTPPRVPGEIRYNWKDALNEKPAAAACGFSLDLRPQLVVWDHTETVGATSSKPQHSKTAGDELRLRHIFLTFIRWKLTAKASQGHRFKGKGIKNRLSEKGHIQREDEGWKIWCNSSWSHNGRHFKAKCPERFVPDLSLDWPSALRINAGLVELISMYYTRTWTHTPAGSHLTT